MSNISNCNDNKRAS